MLALSRLEGQRILVGDDIVIEVRKILGNRVVLAITAPDEVVIDREEVRQKKQEFANRPDGCVGRVGLGPFVRRAMCKEVVREVDLSYAQQALCLEISDEVQSEVCSSEPIGAL